MRLSARRQWVVRPSVAAVILRDACAEPVEASKGVGLIQFGRHLPKGGSEVHDVGHVASMDYRAVHSRSHYSWAILKALSYPVAMGATPDNLEPFDIHCGICGGAISVQLRPSDAGAAPEPTRYTCPWCAAEEFRYQLPGNVLWVARGHHTKDVKSQ